MIYLIGGPPRVGKTTLVNHLVQRHPMHAVSTDAIRYMLRHSVPKEVLSPDIFIHFGVDVLTLWEQNHEQTLEEQNRQSKALWSAIREFINSYDEDGIDLIVEGVAVLPEFAAMLKTPTKSIFLGNTSDFHVDIIKESALKNEYDWLHGKETADIEKASQFFTFFSEYVRAESSRYHLRYQEVKDVEFDQSLQVAADYLLAT